MNILYKHLFLTPILLLFTLSVSSQMEGVIHQFGYKSNIYFSENRNDTIKSLFELRMINSENDIYKIQVGDSLRIKNYNGEDKHPDSFYEIELIKNKQYPPQQYNNEYFLATKSNQAEINNNGSKLFKIDRKKPLVDSLFKMTDFYFNPHILETVNKTTIFLIPDKLKLEKPLPAIIDEWIAGGYYHIIPNVDGNEVFFHEIDSNSPLAKKKTKSITWDLQLSNELLNKINSSPEMDWQTFIDLLELEREKELEKKKRNGAISWKDTLRIHNTCFDPNLNSLIHICSGSSKKKGIIMENGKFIIPLKYKSITFINEKINPYFYTESKGRKDLYKLNGELIYENLRSIEEINIKDEVYFIGRKIIDKEFRSGLINQNGNVVMEFDFKEINKIDNILITIEKNNYTKVYIDLELFIKIPNELCDIIHLRDDYYNLSCYVPEKMEYFKLNFNSTKEVFIPYSDLNQIPSTLFEIYPVTNSR